VRRLGFPWSPALVERSRRSVGGTIAAARAALLDGVGLNLAGGTHHAFADRGEGFCVFNDVAVAARALQAEGAVEGAAVIDCDVHQGNGTAAIFAGDPRVFTLSIHGRGNYPFVKERSDLDVELPDGAGDAEYLAALDGGLDRALEVPPGLVFYIAGADAYHGDRYGRLALSRGGLAERDRRVLGRCAAMGLPVAVVMGGGYAAVEAVVAIHLETVRTAAASVGGRAPRGAAEERIV
jgi:acetoin utilization deacetylase AcuC-like enzyme